MKLHERQLYYQCPIKSWPNAKEDITREAVQNQAKNNKSLKIGWL